MLSEKQILELQRPFTFAEHGFVQKNPYILKSAIRDRLNRITPGWQLLPPELMAVDGDVVVMRGGIQIGDVKRYGVGTGLILRADKDGVKFEGVKLTGMIAKAYKAAASDILPRAALEFGVGEYLKNKPSDIKEVNFAAWLTKLTTPADPNAWTVDNVAEWVEKWLAKDLTETQLFKALGIVEKYREFKGTVATADTAVEAYIEISKLGPAQPRSAAGAPRLPMFECPTHLLEEGDIIYQCVKDDHGPVETRYEVIANWGAVGREFKLILKNLKTGKTDIFMWADRGQTLCDGPKVKMVVDHPELLLPGKFGGAPQWNGQLAATS